MKYWLIKSEGACYSIDDLKRDTRTAWEGIRNYQARNFMMRDMKPGDVALFYHSSDSPSGVYGIAEVASEAKPDMTQFEKTDEHFDPKAHSGKPIWYCVDVVFKEKFKNPVSLEAIKADPKLEGILVTQRGSRLSIQPVSKGHFIQIRKRGHEVD